MLMDFHNRSGSMPAPPGRSPGGGGGGGGVGGYGGGVRGPPADLLPPLELAVAVRIASLAVLTMVLLTMAVLAMSILAVLRPYRLLGIDYTCDGRTYYGCTYYGCTY